jgi:hypothetical protein
MAEPNSDKGLGIHYVLVSTFIHTNGGTFSFIGNYSCKCIIVSAILVTSRTGNM